MVEVDKEVEETKVVEVVEEAPKLAEEEVKPTPTLYVRNLNDKVNDAEMRTCLYHLFSTYGEVIQVRMRQT